MSSNVSYIYFINNFIKSNIILDLLIIDDKLHLIPFFKHYENKNHHHTS